MANSPLPTLIKVHQHEVDEQRRALAALETIGARLAQQLDDLHAQVTHEKEVARHDHEAATRWPAFLSYALKHEQDLNAQIAEMQQQIDRARDELQRRFEQLKKFELAHEAALAAAAAAAARTEQQALDEIAANGDRRKKT